LLRVPPPVRAIDVAATEVACPTRDVIRTHQQDHLRFGPRWEVVQRAQRGEISALAVLELPDDFVGDLEHFALHPALFDLGTGFAMNLIQGYTGERLWVPVGYRRIRVLGSLPRRVLARARVHPGASEASGFATFDVELCDPEGTVCVYVEGFTIKAIDGPLDVGLGRRPLASEVELDPVPRSQRPLSRPELVFQNNLTQGIRPDEGKRMATRALAAPGRPVTYVSSMDLPGLRSQAEELAIAQTRPAGGEGSAVFARPDLEAEYLAPRNDLEESLVAIWQELLGVNEIGVQDSFFDLGGHSLIAVRLFARVRKVFSVDFPISILFEAPTVESIAELIADAAPAARSDDADDHAATDTDSTVVATPPRPPPRRHAPR
jgi:acyl carrier protein